VKIRLGCRQLNLLLEALRRFTRFVDSEGRRTGGDELTRAWTGLGSASAYAPVVNAGLMTVATSPNPRYSTWWRLTEKGAKVVQHWIDSGYGNENVENGWQERGIHYEGKTGISPHSFFWSESENPRYAHFDFEKGEFV